MTSPRTRARTLAALAAAAAVLLSGCGALQPGTAVRINDDRVTMNDVDALAEAICTAETEGFKAQGMVLPGRYIRAEAAFKLFVEAAAAQYAAEHDIDPRPAYTQALSEARPTIESLPTDQREAYTDGVRADAYVAAVITRVGEEALREQGVTEPEPGAAQQQGGLLVQEWLATADIEFDPRIGLVLTDEGFQQVDTDTSFPVSDVAVRARGDQPDPAWAGQLSPSLTCG
ncbi:hypothetical protein [Nocardioides sp.]|uniref:hypothetical protein n=1 Tax=Nocardioides sp. TaxID=35761 RepID=UPI00273372FA|nr:hypothetical protein [Nocardioides sp.]MDP3894603.1 hypothetical protein [Nocardioides sp.]